MKGIIGSTREKIYYYRHDIAALSALTAFIALVTLPMYKEGHIVFSDLDFGLFSDDYMGEVFGVWNERWSTSTLFNTPRLLYLAPAWMISVLLGGRGDILIKVFIFTLLNVSGYSMYLFSKRLFKVYFGTEFNFFNIFAFTSGAVFYALNPWVIFRIQHVYLLCGYSLFPMVLRVFFDLFDPKFQSARIRGHDRFSARLHRENVKDAFLLAIILTLSSAAIHYFFYAGIYLSVLATLLLAKTLYEGKSEGSAKLRAYMLNFFKKSLLFGVFFSMMSFYWLSLYILGMVFGVQASQNNINVVDTLLLFSRNSSVKNVLYFISYWWPMFSIEKIGAGFYSGGAVLLGLMAYGAVSRAYKDTIVAIFTIISMAFIVLATGVKYVGMAPLFAFIVTNVPVIGSIFRDPNKFIGLIAVGFSILLTFGVESFFEILGESFLHFLIRGFVLTVVIASMILYVQPLRENFIKGFYSPVEVPKDMKDAYENISGEGDGFKRVLHMPIADEMVQPHTGVATPFWNKNGNKEGFVKATGDFQVYSSKERAIFHHEGSKMSVGYYMVFLQELIDRGLSSNIGELFSAFAVQDVLYRDEYIGQEKRQDFNRDVLDIQNGIQKYYENGIYSNYSIKNNPKYIYALAQKILTPYGFTRLESYMDMDGFTFDKSGVVFSNMDSRQSDVISQLGDGDLVEAIEYDDMFLSSVPDSYYAYPFDHVDSANAFLNWSKAFVKNSDWLWYLKSQGIDNSNFEFDRERGVAVTFASAKLDVQPYMMDHISGNIVADFNSLLKRNKFFVPDNPQFFSVQANPKKELSNVKLLRGQIVKGDPKDIWQVAKSGLIEAKENNPYRFNVVVSGRGVNKMHVKMRFFDEEMDEIGVSYVVAPGEETDYSEVNFYGEYVSPKGAKYMRMDILSFQNTRQRSYWWIHDIKIEDLHEYRAPNSFNVHKGIEKGAKQSVYMKAFESKAGGQLQLELAGQKIDVDMKGKSMSRFKWIRLGDFEFEGESADIKVTNVSGFNSVASFVVIPKRDEEILKGRFEIPLQKSKLFFVLEAENDMDYSGNMQSSRSYPMFSGGKGVRSQSGSLCRRFDILKSGMYSMQLNVDSPGLEGSSIEVAVNDSDGALAFKREIELDRLEGGEAGDEIVVDYDENSGGFPYSLIDIKREGLYYKVEISDMRMKKGSYEMTVTFNSNAKSLSTFEDVHKFNPDELQAPEFLEDIFQENCSDCEKIDPSMMKKGISKDKQTMRLDYEATCSCDWYVYASRMMDIQESEEYLVSFKARSENITKRHLKVYFMDGQKKVIGTQFINEVEENEKNRWNDYQQIVKAPEGSKYMQLHIWCRGDKTEAGYFEMKDYSTIKFTDMTLLDSIVVFEGKSISDLFKVEDAPVISWSRVDSMKRDIHMDNPTKKAVLISFGESPSKLWINTFDGKKLDIAVNGVRGGFISTGNGKASISIIFRRVYYVGILMIGLSFVLYFAIMRIWFRRGKRGESIEKKHTRIFKYR
ncbi:hypothetical protein [Peptoclostridium litorale]|uniref:hypothetical protein n=1 Tax=Peptoclostridium litorale TaxID=1557 RepID=UPI00069870C0|nr:hypothetical protein [Peptoclostridium litorale]